MRRLLVLILLGAFISVNFSKLIILVHYELYKAEITQKYCVNKDKPWMHCCGKCHLKKQLAQDNKQKQSPIFPTIKIDIQLFSSYYAVDLCNNDNMYSLVDSPYMGVYLPGIPGSLFHPPSV